MEEEDDILDFRFDEGTATQPYLSLGLTPLSQQSPSDHGPSSAGGDGSDYFFPSMLPPVTPISSVFSISGPNSNPGIPIDSPFNISGGGAMMMPEANPSERSTASANPRKPRKGKLDVPVHGLTLDPVPELSCSLDDNPYPTNFINGIIGSSSSSNSTDDPSTGLLFPSADPHNDYPSHLQRKTGKRPKSGTRRKLEDGHHLNVDQNMGVKNRAFMDSTPVRLTPSYSPREEGRRIRQETREMEMVKQKERLRKKKVEEEQTRLLNREKTMLKIAHDYGSTRKFNSNQDLRSPLNIVQQEALRIDAQIELMNEETNHQVSVL